MSGSGKADNGRGNSRRRSRRRNRDSENLQGTGAPFRDGRASSPGNSAEGRERKSSGQRRAGEQGAVPENRGRRGSFRNGGSRTEKSRVSLVDRPKWTPPKMNTDPLPVPDCPWCGKPIRDLSQAIADRETGAPVHFECVAARIAGGENLEKGDAVTYIGGGRFGIVHFGDSQGRRDNHDFAIKKIIEWENKDERAQWRTVVSEHYSVT